MTAQYWTWFPWSSCTRSLSVVEVQLKALSVAALVAQSLRAQAGGSALGGGHGSRWGRRACPRCGVAVGPADDARVAWQLLGEKRASRNSDERLSNNEYASAAAFWSGILWRNARRSCDVLQRRNHQ
eukprot:518594-Amphidinium_carterae.1